MREEELQYVIDNMDILYDFVMTGAENIGREHVYGEISMNMVMTHTLVAIAENPGLRVSDIAKIWDHTRGAASRNVDRLRRLGLITKEKRGENKKEVYLYPTRQGTRIARLHEKGDRESIGRITEKLLETHSFDRVKEALSVMDTLRKLFREELI